MNRFELAELIYDSYDHWDAADRIIAKYGWQPIETAPKDGTEILVWAHMFNPIYKTLANVRGRYIVSWRETWTGGGTNAEQVEAWCVSETYDANDEVWDRVYPIRWMPLPEEP